MTADKRRITRGLRWIGSCVPRVKKPVNSRCMCWSSWRTGPNSKAQNTRYERRGGYGADEFDPAVREQRRSA